MGQKDIMQVKLQWFNTKMVGTHTKVSLQVQLQLHIYDYSS
jgi:hypothetical protein